MKLHRIVLVTLALLVLGAPVLAQEGEYGRGRDSANLQRLAAELTQQTDALAQQTYGDYSSRTTNGRTETEGIIVAQQLNATAIIFRRMVDDHRHRSELRDAGGMLSDLAARGDSYSTRGRWAAVQRTINDIQAELTSRGGFGNGGGNGNGGGIGNGGGNGNGGGIGNGGGNGNGGGIGNGGGNGNGDNNGNGGRFPGEGNSGGGFPGGGSGTVRWRGTVDDVVELNLQGNSIDPKAISGTPYNDATFDFSSPLPNRSANVQVRKLHGRGEVSVIQQPNRSNDYTAIIQIRDGNKGSDNYEIEISW